MTTTTITVKCCAECPFFVQTMKSMLAGWLAGPANDKTVAGECDHTARTERRVYPLGEPGEGPARERERRSSRLRVIDGNALPSQCPLRVGDVVVTLGS